MRVQAALHRARLLEWQLRSVFPEHGVSCRTPQGKFTVSSRDQEIGRKLFLQKSFDYDKVEKGIHCLRQLAHHSWRQSQYLVDIGANVGTVCIPLVRDGVFARALAFEPEPRNFRFLRKNVKANGLSDPIRVFDYALSNSEAMVEMELSLDNYGDHRVRLTNPLSSENEHFNESKRKVVTVRGCRLDDVLSGIGILPSEIALLWIDVQGHELYVLQGAQAVLRAGTPVIAEFWPYGLLRAGVSAQSLVEFISSRFTSFYDLNTSPMTRRSSSDIRNLFSQYQGISFTDLLLIND